MIQYRVKLTMGDWSDDGHGKYNEHYYDSNYPVEKIQQAYKDSCRLTGITFNHNEDYTEQNLGYGHEQQVWTEYEDSEMSDTAFAILQQFGINLDPDIKDGIDEKTGASIIMQFIALSMPEDWVYIEQDDVPAINGWWNNELNVQFGYGLFC